MSDIHIDDFCRDVARTLLALYGVFPRRTAIFVTDIAGDFEPDEFGVPHKRHQACFSTLLWLAEEGFLRYDDTIRQEAIDQAVLTGRAFTLLCAPVRQAEPPATPVAPESVLREQRSHVFALRRILKDRDSAALKILVLDMLQALQQR